MKITTQQQFFIPARLPFLEIRTTIDSALPYAEHFHTSFSFGLILAGTTCISLGKNKYSAESGDIALIAPEQAHSCNPVGSGSRGYHMAHVDASWFHQSIGMALYQKRGVRIGMPVIKDANLFTEALNLIKAVKADAVAAERDLAELLLKMHRSHNCFLPASNSPGHHADALPGISAVNQIIEGRYSITGLAQCAGVRRESFSRSFHKAAGLAPSCYLHCLRLEHGRRMLQQGSNIAEAAVSSGYVDQSHFHRMFVKYCSVTPGCYRKNQSHLYKK